MVYYNAYITGEYNALYTPTNHGFFIAQLTIQIDLNDDFTFAIG